MSVKSEQLDRKIVPSNLDYYKIRLLEHALACQIFESYRQKDISKSL